LDTGLNMTTLSATYQSKLPPAPHTHQPGDILGLPLSVVTGGTGAATLTGMLKGNGTSPISQANASNDYVAPATACTFTAKQTFSGTSSSFAVFTPNIQDDWTIQASAATGTINYDISLQSGLFYSTAATANWVVNFRMSASTTLDAAMGTETATTVKFLVQQGAAPFINTGVTIGASTVTLRWQGGVAPAAGTPNGIDVYTYTIFKTAAGVFTVFATMSDKISADLSAEITARTSADTTLTNNKVSKSGDTMSGALLNTARIVAGASDIAGMDPGSVGAGWYAAGAGVLYNAYAGGGGGRAIAAGYSTMTTINTSTGVWSIQMGTNVAAGAAVSYTPVLNMDASGNASFISTTGTLRAYGGRIVSTVAGAATVCAYNTAGGINTAAGMYVDTLNRLSFGFMDGGGTNTLGVGFFDTSSNFTVVGAVATKASGTTWANPSDARIKQDVQDYRTGLDDVVKLRPVSFKYRPQTNYPEELLNTRQVGFIAQEVEDVMPDMVTSAPGQVGDIKLDDLRTLDTNNLVFALVNATKTLSAKLDDALARIEALETAR
jgi:hypothetical protein